jgi:hypothetical protein
MNELLDLAVEAPMQSSVFDEREGFNHGVL